MTDFDNMNPIIYCQICDTGFHEKCYGIEPEREIQDDTPTDESIPTAKVAD